MVTNVVLITICLIHFFTHWVMKQITLKTIKSMFRKTISKTMNYSGKRIKIILVHSLIILNLRPFVPDSIFLSIVKMEC